MTLLKKYGLTALAAAMIVGSTTLSHAESNISDADNAPSGSVSTSSALQSDRVYDNAYAATGGGTRAYGYVTERETDRPTRKSTRMKHNY